MRHSNDKMYFFATDVNLVNLCQATSRFCNGTFDKSPSLFNTDSVHSFVSGKMVPLVYGLLSDKKDQVSGRTITVYITHCKTVT